MLNSNLAMAGDAVYVDGHYGKVYALNARSWASRHQNASFALQCLASLQPPRASRSAGPRAFASPHHSASRCRSARPRDQPLLPFWRD